jgi:zinc transporter 1
MGHGMHKNHEHSHNRRKCSCSKTLRLSMMMFMTFSFFLVELIVGEKTNSITLVADAFHMLSDVIGKLFFTSFKFKHFRV